MYSIEQLDEIWDQEMELYDGSFGRPEQVYGTEIYHHIEPRIQAGKNLSNLLTFASLKVNPNVVAEIDPETGFIVLKPK